METDIDVLLPRIEPYLDVFDGVLRRGHAVYESYPPEVAIDHDASTQAHCTYRHILKEAHLALDALPHVEHMDIRGQNVWLFKDANVVLRLKKTDENGASSNYPTPQALAFDVGEELPGLPAAPTRLTVGYLLDETGMGFKRSQVSLPTRRGALWCAAIIPADMRAAEDRAWYEVTKQSRFRL
ncbi:MAG: hypothetical protein Q8S58_12160 [Bosea sp. (in: a-proteobacteria)]|uniref:hypothetical protein n=1 Tax=Bosea sp. (in: a-proteobacteria) TaxID=1871050 RepID=UPI0027347EE3|nr:hypothetical protein [Bosea sp. (in: a-proteobacteria)]MDP3255454.1 hypothetical protein [Bosea sp. (in: a-proteobacteria)]MDP3319874.1 hypothetical protein [Bosea sp. (in: a-proteobacteria)]